jgi:choline dehydrogenase-like flavoprotein
MSVRGIAEGEAQHSKLRPEREPGLMFLTYALRPTSTGSVHVAMASAGDNAVVDPNYMATEHDREVTIDAFLRLRELIEQNPLSEVVDFESSPGCSVASRDDILNEIIVNGSTGYHSLGTCAMGPDDAVVDSKLRVRGVNGLRVVDASVFPTMPSGNCNMPTMAFAWRAADLILNDR